MVVTKEITNKYNLCENGKDYYCDLVGLYLTMQMMVDNSYFYTKYDISNCLRNLGTLLINYNPNFWGGIETSKYLEVAFNGSASDKEINDYIQKIVKVIEENGDFENYQNEINFIDSKSNLNESKIQIFNKIYNKFN